MDVCVEDGERTMFRVQKECKRLKALLMACELNQGDCEDKLQSLYDCTRCVRIAPLQFELAGCAVTIALRE